MLNKNIKRGQIYQAELGNKEGSEQGGTRPVLIISNDLNNKFSPTITVLPITSRTKNNLPTHVDVCNTEGLEKPSTVLTEQIITIDKSKLIKQLGVCNYNKLIEVENALLIQVGINHGTRTIAI